MIFGAVVVEVVVDVLGVEVEGLGAADLAANERSIAAVVRNEDEGE